MSLTLIVKLGPSSTFGVIKIHLADNVNPDMFSNLPSLEIKPGLRTKFCRPHHRKDVLVTVSWLDMETPNELLYHLFSHFGKVNSSIADCVYKKNEKDSDLASLLDGVPNGERQFWMTVTTPLPSYGIIDGKRVKIFHVGQARTCARCHCTRDVCPGQANARQCEDNGGEKKNLEDFWRKTLQDVDYSQWAGGEVEKEENYDTCNEEEPEGNTNNKEYKYEGMIFDNFMPDVTAEDLGRALLENNVKIPDGATSCRQGERSLLMTDISQEEIVSLSAKIDKLRIKLGGKTIRCKPYVIGTPIKTMIENTESDNTENDGSRGEEEGEQHNSQSSPTLRQNIIRIPQPSTSTQEVQLEATALATVYPPGLSAQEIAQDLKKRNKKEKQKETKAAKKALKDLELSKNASPFRSEFARRLSIGDRLSVGTNIASETERDDVFAPDNCTVFDNGQELESDGDTSSGEEEDDKGTSPVAAALGGKNKSKKRDRDSPQDTTRSTRPKSSNGSRLPTKK